MKKKEKKVKSKSNNDFCTRQTKQVKFNTGIIRFSSLYGKTSVTFKYCFSAVLGLLMAFLTAILVENTGLYTGGIAAMFQGVARLSYVGLSQAGSDAAELVYNALFWGLYLIFNIPLIIFAYFKINRQFAMLSMVYLVVLQVSGFMFGLIPGVDNLMIFGDTHTVDQNLANMNVQVLLFSPNCIPGFDPNGGTNILDWDNMIYINEIDKNNFYQSSVLNQITTENITRIALLAVYAIVFAFCTASVYSLLYITGSSSAGSDFISIYFSQEKNMPLGKILTTICLSCMLVGILLGSYSSSAMVNGERYSGWQYLISGNLVCSLLWVVLNGLLIDKIFPWHKLVRVEIYTDKIQLIKNKLRENNYIHPTTIVDARGGYSDQSKNILISICMVVELPKLVKAIRDVDDRCLVSTSFVADLDGYMKMQKQTG